MIKQNDLKKLRTVSIRSRTSKVSVKDFAKPGKLPAGLSKKLFRLIPPINFGADFHKLVALIKKAKKKKKPVIFMFGAHVIKCGLSPVVIDLMRRGYITALATNGASIIHDFETAYCGKTSEIVDKELGKGTFGITKETAEFVNSIAVDAAREDAGIGYMAGRKINTARLKHRDNSIFAQAYRLKVPMTSHIAIGTDVVHQHPNFDGACWGKASQSDFLKLCNQIKGLGGGGVVLNFGSAVILPEVFLKALNLCRNLGYNATGFTAANFDMIKHYRPITNIVNRPTMSGGHGFNFIGHHEFMLPLLYAGVTSGK